jgi:hypothetical protein
MKKLIFILAGLVILTSCATTKVEETSKKESADEKNIVQQADIKQAVDMRRFLIKFNRLYNSQGGIVELFPRSNYILLEGDRVVISAAYIGRQFGYRPVKGIDMVGKAVTFEMKSNAKGVYDIRMKVKNESNTFDVFITITDNGRCDASLINYRLDHVRYTGNFIPLRPIQENQKKEEKVIPEQMSI